MKSVLLSLTGMRHGSAKLVLQMSGDEEQRFGAVKCIFWMAFQYGLFQKKQNKTSVKSAFSIHRQSQKTKMAKIRTTH